MGCFLEGILDIRKQKVAKKKVLTAWQTLDKPPKIVDPDLRRDWMDLIDDPKFLKEPSIKRANGFGWDVLNPVTFRVLWSGEDGKESLRIHWPSDRRSNIPLSVFGRGVLSFQLGYLFEAWEGMDILLKGPPNRYTEGLFPIEELVESFRRPTTYLMNWKLVVKNVPLVFEAGESICRVIPVSSRALRGEFLDPQIRLIGENPSLLMRMEKGPGMEEFTIPKEHQAFFRDRRARSVRFRDQAPREDLRAVSFEGPGGRKIQILVPNLEKLHDSVEEGTDSVSSLLSGDEGKPIEVSTRTVALDSRDNADVSDERG